MSTSVTITASSTFHEMEGWNNVYNNVSSSGVDTIVGQDYHDSTQFDYRTLFRFGISSIPQGAKIAKVNMRMVAVQDASSVDFNVQIRKYNWAGVTPGSGAYAAALSSTLDQAWRSTSGMSLNTQYTSPDLDTAWIQAFLDASSSYYYYSLVSSRDAAGNAPSGNEYIRIATQSNGTSSYRPVLIVEYDLGRPFSVSGFIGL